MHKSHAVNRKTVKVERLMKERNNHQICSSFDLFQQMKLPVLDTESSSSYEMPADFSMKLNNNDLLIFPKTSTEGNLCALGNS